MIKKEEDGKRRKRKKEKTEKEDDELKKLLAELNMKKIRVPIARLPIRRTGGGKPAPKIFGFPHFPRIPSEPKLKINPTTKLENYGRRNFGWSEPIRPKTEKVIIRNEPDAEQLLKVLENNPKLYEKISEKLLEKMNEEFDEQLEANVNDSEKFEKERKSIEDGLREVDSAEKELSFEEFAERYPLELEGKELLSEDTRQEIMRRAYENYLGNEVIKRLTEKEDETINDESEVNDKTEKEDSIEDEQREIIERLGITPDEDGKVDLGEVLEKLGEEEGMAIFPLGELEIEEGSEQSEADESKKLETNETDIVEHSQEPRTIEPNVEVQRGESEVPKVAEQAELNVITQLESQDLSSLEAELIQPEVEPIEPDSPAEPLEEVESENR
jgi:hypothetical protein